MIDESKEKRVIDDIRKKKAEFKLKTGQSSVN
jgi:hypothetical protein